MSAVTVFACGRSRLHAAQVPDGVRLVEVPCTGRVYLGRAAGLACPGERWRAGSGASSTDLQVEWRRGSHALRRLAGSGAASDAGARRLPRAIRGAGAGDRGPTGCGGTIPSGPCSHPGAIGRCPDQRARVDWTPPWSCFVGSRASHGRVPVDRPGSRSAAWLRRRRGKPHCLRGRYPISPSLGISSSIP